LSAIFLNEFRICKATAVENKSQLSPTPFFYDVVGVLAVVDRERGGIEELRRRYGRATALFKSSEFPALVEFQRAAAKAQ
jgi:hypothetical protein